ncbi:MAG: TetR/AcrR family transcriptional regulator [Pseudomonadota bacterium]
MARPSLKDVRSREILDAFVRCVARYGVDGSTLERIAEEAGMRRTLLRHYLGNREDMVTRLLHHTLSMFEDMIDLLVEDLPEKNRWPVLFDRLFSHEQHSPANAAVFQALVAASAQHPALKQPLLGFVTDFERMLCHEISLQHPAAGRNRCAVAASGITSIYFSVDAMLPLSPSIEWRQRQKNAAAHLTAALQGSVSGNT